MDRTRVIIMGAAGRDFHNFNVVFREDPRFEVVAFTAAQIPNIERRLYPPSLAGHLYPSGIPILSEDELDAAIDERRVDQVVFAYSDLSHEEVMHKASRIIARGADFRLIGARATMIPSERPVVTVCAVRTGAGKSPVSRKVASILRAEGLKTVVLRHPMPYGDLTKQAVQRFAGMEDLERSACTIEEMEEYEPHLRRGNVVYAGVDYVRILREAEEEADVILWDGGNNDLPFIAPDMEVVVADPHRAGDERRYFPGEVNLLRADIVVLTKLHTAPQDKTEALRASIKASNPQAVVVDSAMPVTVDQPDRIRGARVLVVEDGPTVTHGGMRFGAGVLAARQFGARELVDPRPSAAGSIQDTFAQYPHITDLLPAMGYGAQQVRDLEATISRVECDVILIATPVDLRRIIRIRQPTCRVTYELEEIGHPTLQEALQGFIVEAKRHA